MSDNRADKTTSEIRLYFYNLARGLRLIWQWHPWLMTATMILVLLGSIQSFAANGSFALLLNELTGGDIEAKTLWLLLALYVGALSLPRVLQAVREYFDNLLWLYVPRDLVLLFLRKKAELDMARFEDPKFQDLLQRATEKGEHWPMQQITNNGLWNMWNLIGIVISVVALGAIDLGILGLVVLATVPVFWVESKTGGILWNIYSAEAPERRRFQMLQDHLSNKNSLLELRLFGRINYFLELARATYDRFIDKQAGLEKRRMVWLLLAGIWGLTLIGTTVVLTVRMVLTGELQVGTFTFVLSTIYALEVSLTTFLRNMGYQREASLIVKDQFEVLDTKPLVVDQVEVEKIDLEQVPEICFENVWFSYPFGSRKDDWVLRNFSLTIRPGEKIALIGVNGAGKSTIIKLLCRFYDPQKGLVLVGGKDLRMVARNDLYKLLSVLFQEFGEYKFTVKEAIALGKGGEDAAVVIEKVVEAAVQSQASEFIEKWEKGYDSQLGVEFEGKEPSKGQQQKLALARSFYAEPKVLVLDEPTAALDAEAEAKIFENLERWAGQRTLILISHRFSTVRDVDRIIVLKDGKVHEDGSHNDLMASDGTYASLFRKQAKGYLSS